MNIVQNTKISRWSRQIFLEQPADLAETMIEAKLIMEVDEWDLEQSLTL
jgi:hypothetical protein